MEQPRMVDEAALDAALDRVVAALPGGGEVRPGQRAMAQAVASAFINRRHLLVEAGTGTGKSLAYLIPAILTGQRTVVVTATKALQEQLVHKDLPFLRRHLDVDFTYALLKGRSNYVCLAKLAALDDPAQQAFVGVDPSNQGVRDIRAWVETTPSGDRSDLSFSAPGWVWQAVSVDGRECPGASKCSQGPRCFAEMARDRAHAADVVVVNTHLYGVHLASGGNVLPEHDLVVLDEAHTVEDTIAATFGLELAATRFEHAARAARGVFTRDAQVVDALSRLGYHLERMLNDAFGTAGQRIDPTADPLGAFLLQANEALAEMSAMTRRITAQGETEASRLRLAALLDALRNDLQEAMEAGPATVAWIEGGGRGGSPTLKIAPVDVGPKLAATLFTDATVVATSATLAVGGEFDVAARRLGLAPDEYDGLAVASPFDYARQALLYCPVHLPDPRDPDYSRQMLDELEALILAAGGRTLALFTSRRAFEEASERLAKRLPFKVLVQDALPRPKLVEEFMADEQSCLFATMGFWQGIDVPGRTCSLVTIDKLPFPRPDEPLYVARRAVAASQGLDAFRAIDLPRAAMLLAQGAGRLVRTREDRGVVAVFDRRLAKARYNWTLVRSLPPMGRTRHRHEVEAFLRAAHADPAGDHPDPAESMSGPRA
jgi:ATP-dependent DNA helicase DinG